jgi:hypothetical protein
MLLDDEWPPLPLDDWRASYETLHLWTQIAGKVRIGLTPLVNHWWNSTLYVTPRGLTTSEMPHAGGALEIRFDFIDHVVIFETTGKHELILPLQPETCAAFYDRFFSALKMLGVDVKIQPMSCELPVNVRLDQDVAHQTYDKAAVNRWFRALLTIDTIFKEFRADFIGKSSPVHFLLGQLRSRRYALQRAACSRAARRRPAHTRGVFT